MRDPITDNRTTSRSHPRVGGVIDARASRVGARRLIRRAGGWKLMRAARAKLSRHQLGRAYVQSWALGGCWALWGIPAAKLSSRE